MKSINDRTILGCYKAFLLISVTTNLTEKENGEPTVRIPKKQAFQIDLLHTFEYSAFLARTIRIMSDREKFEPRLFEMSHESKFCVYALE